jgi:hypothetical protein
MSKSWLVAPDTEFNFSHVPNKTVYPLRSQYNFSSELPFQSLIRINTPVATGISTATVL